MSIPHFCKLGPNGEPCGNVRKGEAYTLDQCRNCWLGEHDGAYRLLWGIPGHPTHAPRLRTTMATFATPTPIGHGPGTELKALLESLGAKANAGCSCNQKAAEMDAWGVSGCRERRDEIKQFLRDNAAERGWFEKAKAAALATAQGLAFQLNFSDIYGSLVDLAIQRAEASQS